uniref:Uncharacterized protein n=1 Tax=Lactuca sativa TaxID=4236 RepID=A0A9R1XQJ2_LACSA|nr:hypothetical protein LSAT_V11C200064370 [Lactuca sativa]
MPRSTRTGTPLQFDREIEKTTRKLRKEALQHKEKEKPFTLIGSVSRSCWFGAQNMGLVTISYISLTPRRLINASSGGSLSDMTSTEIQALIEKLEIESKHSANEEEWYPN